MTVDSIIKSAFNTEDFAQYKQDGYAKHQEMVEREIIAKLNQLLSNALFLMLLKHWGAQSACRFLEYREITVRLPRKTAVFANGLSNFIGGHASLHVFSGCEIVRCWAQRDCRVRRRFLT